MKNILILVLLIFITGCSQKQIRNNFDLIMQATSGDTPPTFFKFKDEKVANEYILKHDEFKIKTPLAKKEDWSSMGGWNGAYVYGGIGIGLEQIKSNTRRGSWITYNVDITTSKPTKYGNTEKALVENNIGYFRSQFKKRTDNHGNTLFKTISIENHGKENYLCDVSEHENLKRENKIKIS